MAVDDPRRELVDPSPLLTAEDYRRLAIALGAANVALPQIADLLARIERRVSDLQLAQTRPSRDKYISHHDAEEIVAQATRSDRVRKVVERTALEAGGRLLVWALGIAAALVIAGAVGFMLRDCAAHGPPLIAPEHP